MEPMEIRRYIRLYWFLFKRNLITTLTYRFSILLELFVEIAYQYSFLLLIEIIFSNVTNIGSWTRYEMMFFVGYNMLISELLLSTVFIGLLFKLPEKIVNGDLDVILTKPVNSMFILSFGGPYISGLVSGLPGIYLMFYSVLKGHLIIDPTNLLLGLILGVMGFVMVYCIATLLSSLSFKFVGAKKLPRFSSDFLLNFSSYPSEVFENIIRRAFTYFLPILFLSAIPFKVVLKGNGLYWITVGFFIMVTLFLLTKKLWKKMVLNYSSASS